MTSHDRTPAPRRAAHVSIMSAFAAAIQLAAGTQQAMAAAAGSPAPDSAEQLQEVVITARNRSEVLQDVPLAVTAVSSQELLTDRIQDIRDLTNLVAGLQETDQGAGYQTRPIIRGIAQTNIYGVSDNNVSTFLDGVYIYNPSVINLSLFDIERVEVVKGPVSALYGRNAFAGAINYVTPVPTDKPSARVYVSGGSQKRWDAIGSLGGALIPGVLDGRVAAGYQTSDGYWSDPVSGRRLNGFQKRGAQLSLRFRPTENFVGDLLLYFGRNSYDPFAAALLPFTCANVGGLNQKYCGQLPRGDKLPFGVQYPAKGGQDDTGLTSEFKTVHLKLGYDLGFGTINSISAYSKSDARQYVSFDFTRDGLPFPLSPGPGTANIRTFIGEAGLSTAKEYSEELRLTSRQDQRLRWGVGGFFYRVDGVTLVQIGMDLSEVPAGQTVQNFFTSIWGTSHGQPSNATTRSVERTTQKSGFGSLDFDLTDALTASGELRYTNSPLESHQLSLAVFPSQTSFPVLKSTETYTSGRFTLRYKFAQDLMVYASAANGQHDGGFNQNATLPQDQAFGPEQNRTYELGMKSSVLARRVLVDAALFYSKLTNLQILSPASDSPQNPAELYKNYGSGSAKGMELEVQAKIVTGLSASLGLAYTDPTFGRGTYNVSAGDTANCSTIPSCAPRVTTFRGSPAIDVSGWQLIFASKYQANTGLDANYPLTGDWRWFGHADYSFLSRYYYTLNNYQWVGNRSNVNAVLGVSAKHWRAELWGKNLSNDLTATFSAPNLRLNDFRFQDNVYLPDGRSYGVALTYTY